VWPAWLRPFASIDGVDFAIQVVHSPIFSAVIKCHCSGTCLAKDR
jgi:hypothetical protein